MKIWFDLSNSPHINLFGAMIRDLQREHEVIITCRPLANTVDLLDLHGFKYTVVGTHYGGKLINKIFGFPIRAWHMMKFLVNKNIDVAISQSTFNAPLVSRLLGVRCIYMNDNEHALGNIPAFLCANKIMIPEFLSIKKLKKQLANPRKIDQYPGVKEGIYLWELDERLDQQILNNQSKLRSTVYIRPEPWTAQYYKGSKNFMDTLILAMKDEVDIVLLPRGKEQALHYLDAKFDGIRVIKTALDIADIAPDCDLFIGAGGTMTREMAVLGIPTISVYQDELLDVDKYLLTQKAFLHRPHLTAKEALQCLKESSRQAPNRELLEKGRQAYDKIKSAIVNG